MPFGDSRKNSETLVDTVHQAKALQQEVGNLRTQIQHLRAIAQAMWELLRQSSNSNDAHLVKRVAEIEAELKSGSRVAEACPDCSRALQDGSSFCIYCGAKVERSELF